MNFLKLILLLFLIGFIVLVLLKKSNRKHQSGLRLSVLKIPVYDDPSMYRALD
jgi:hypothetical protein